MEANGAQRTDLSAGPEDFQPVRSSRSQDGFNPLEVRPPDDDSETRDLLPEGVVPFDVSPVGIHTERVLGHPAVGGGCPGQQNSRRRQDSQSLVHDLDPVFVPNPGQVVRHTGDAARGVLEGELPFRVPLLDAERFVSWLGSACSAWRCSIGRTVSDAIATQAAAL